MTPINRKYALAQFIRSHGYSAFVDSTGALHATIAATATNYIWRNTPTFRQVRVALGLPTDYITCTEVQS